MRSLRLGNKGGLGLGSRGLGFMVIGSRIG